MGISQDTFLGGRMIRRKMIALINIEQEKVELNRICA